MYNFLIAYNLKYSINCKLCCTRIFHVLLLILLGFFFIIINEDCSFIVLFYVQFYLYIVYIKEKMFQVEKLVSDPIVFLGGSVHVGRVLLCFF